MDNIMEFGLLAFTSFFTMINPVGFVPLFVSLTANLSHKEATKVATKAVIVAFFVLVLFSLTGQFIFNFFQISVHSLKVVGGIIFFMAGYDMLQARIIRTKDNGETVKDYISDIAITPLAIPIICGPGAITVAIVLTNEANSTLKLVTLFGSIIIILLITLLAAISGRKFIKLIGENGNKVLMRIMGLIVMVIAVEFLFNGLKPILREILKIK